jgi:hypothetical protein
MIDADDANRPVVAAVPGGKAAPDEAAPDEAAPDEAAADGAEPAAGTPAAWAAPLARDEDEEAPEVAEPEHPATSAIPPASRAMTAFFVRMEVGRGQWAGGSAGLVTIGWRDCHLAGGSTTVRYDT